MADAKDQVRSLPKGDSIDEDELEQRKAFLEFGADDVARLRALNEVAETYADPVIEALYQHFLSFQQTRSFFDDASALKRVKSLQKEYFFGLTAGQYGDAYVANRLKIGAVHEHINLAPKWYLGAYNFYLRAVLKRIVQAFDGDLDRVIPAFLSLTKVVFLDIGLAVDTYVHAREATVRKQQAAIRELSTPVLQIRPRLLLLPIIGAIDATRARDITETLLLAIRSHRAKVVVVDITGVATLDSKVANHLSQTVAAAKLMGAKVIITGLSPDVAQALVSLGVDLEKLSAVGDLEEGIEEAERLLRNEPLPSVDTTPSASTSRARLD